MTTNDVLQRQLISRPASQRSEEVSPFENAFLTDAISMQRYIEIAGDFKRVISVVKVRGSAHSTAPGLFSITDDGIILGKPLSELRASCQAAPSK